MKKIFSTFLAIVMLVTSLSVATTAFAKTKTYTVQYHQTVARKMLANVNGFRQAGSWLWNEDNTTKVPVAPMGKLTYDYDLELSAMIRATELIESYGHLRPNGSDYSTSYSVFGECGENIAYLEGYSLNADEMFEMWKEEDQLYENQGHRRDMLWPNYRAFAIACVEYNGCLYWVQEFRDIVVTSTPTAALDGMANVTIDLDGNTKSTIEGYKAPEAKVTVPKITKLKSKKKVVSFAWNNQANVKSYEINYAYNSKFKNKTVKKLSSKYGSMTIKGLSKGKTLYIRIRAKDKKGKTTKWSKTYKIKVK